MTLCNEEHPSSKANGDTERDNIKKNWKYISIFNHKQESHFWVLSDLIMNMTKTNTRWAACNGQGRYALCWVEQMWQPYHKEEGDRLIPQCPRSNQKNFYRCFKKVHKTTTLAFLFGSIQNMYVCMYVSWMSHTQSTLALFPLFTQKESIYIYIYI